MPDGIYANVVIHNGRRAYSGFGKSLDTMIAYAEQYGHGIIAIEEAHAGKPPVWERPPEQ